MPERPNFYVLLDLDPRVWEWSAVEERIRAKHDEWSQQRSHHRKARVRAEECLRYLPEIEACLKDPACRAREAEEAERILAAERKDHQTELDELIELIRSGGGACDRERLDRLAQKFEGVFTREEIEVRLRSAGVGIEGSDAAAPAGPEAGSAELDRHVAREIRRRLDLLGLGDLYEFLDLPVGSRPEALRARAAEVYPENRRLGRHDGIATAQNDLASYCETVFATEATKATYDRYLTVEAMERLDERIELAGADGLLTREEMDALVRKAVELGVDEAAARDHLESLARERGWKVDRGAASRPKPEPTASPAPVDRQEDRAARSLAFLMPYLRALASRPAVAVPASLTVIGMVTVLLASLGAPGPQPPAVASVAPSPPPRAAASAPPRPAAPRTAASGASAAQAAPPAHTGAVPVSPPPGREGGGSSLEPPGEAVPSAAVPPAPASLAPASPHPAPAPNRPPTPPQPPVLPEDPRLVLVTVGDQQIAPLVENAVGRSLRGAGLEVHDNRGSLALVELLRSSREEPSLPAMVRALAGDGFDILVLAEIDSVGQRRLEFYGRTSFATTSRVRLHAYALVDQRAVGSGWSGEVEYTERGAEQQVAKAIEPGATVLGQEIARGWAGRLSAARGRR